MKRPSDESNVIMHATSKTLNFMLDSNAHDAILHHGLSKKIAELVGTGRIVILTTHIQQDEIAETPDLDKRANLQSIGAKRVATSGALWGLSRWGAAEFGDGSGDVKIGDVRTDGPRHIADALIGATAAAKAAHDQGCPPNAATVQSFWPAGAPGGWVQ